MNEVTRGIMNKMLRFMTGISKLMNNIEIPVYNKFKYKKWFLYQIRI